MQRHGTTRYCRWEGGKNGAAKEEGEGGERKPSSILLCSSDAMLVDSTASWVCKCAASVGIPAARYGGLPEPGSGVFFLVLCMVFLSVFLDESLPASDESHPF